MKTFILYFRKCIVMAMAFYVFTPITAKEPIILHPNPQCTLIITEDSYIIDFNLTSYNIRTNEELLNFSCGPYTEIYMDENSDELDIQSYPQLPFISLDLPIPFNTKIIGEIEFHPHSITSTPLKYPIQPSVEIEQDFDTEFGEYENIEHSSCHNHIYYEYGSSPEYPNGFYTNYYERSPYYTIANQRGFTFSIFPFSYIPPQKEVKILQQATFVIRFDNCNLQDFIDTTQADTSFSAYVANCYFDTHIASKSPDKIEFLILAANRKMEPILQEYLRYKVETLGMQVKVLFLDELGIIGDSKQIYDVIHSNEMTGGFPNFVLLIGTLQSIPPFSGADDPQNPFSDSGYHNFIGRWILSDDNKVGIEELYYIIRKTIPTEKAFYTEEVAAALYSGTDSKYLYMRNHFYRDIWVMSNVSFRKMGIPYYLFDGRRTDASITDLKDGLDALNSRFFIYSGHGATDAIGSPYSWQTDQLYYVNTHIPYPMGFGFACHLNDYTSNGSFASRFVANPYGGVSYYGSTTYTKTSPDRVLSRKIFTKYRSLSEKNQTKYLPLSVWLYIAENSYYNALAGKNRKRQILRYNLIGDPTLLVNGYAMLDYKNAPLRRDIKNMNSNEKILNINIYNTAGNLITTTSDQCHFEELFDNLNRGVYIVEYIYSNDTTIVTKQIK